jgi:hypothetical protein
MRRLPTELILRQFFDFASLAQNDVLPAAVLPPKKAQDDNLKNSKRSFDKLRMTMVL